MEEIAVKKIGIALLTIIMLLFVACSNQPDIKEHQEVTYKITDEKNDIEHHDPPQMVILEKSDIQQLKTLNKNDSKMVESFSKSAANGAFKNKENVLTFIETLSPLLVPEINGMQLTSITYLPDSPSIYFVYADDNSSSWYRFEFVLNPDTVKKVMEDIVHGKDNQTETINDKIKLLMIVKINDSELAKHYSECWLEINGFLVKGIYNNNQENMVNTNIKNILKNMNAVPLINTNTCS